MTNSIFKEWRITLEEKEKIAKKGDRKVISIFKNMRLSKLKFMLNKNIANLKKIPHLKIIWNKRQANNFIRNAISPDPTNRVYLWLDPNKYSTIKRVDDMSKKPSKIPSIEEPSFLKNCEDPDLMMRLMSMYTQKKPVSQFPNIIHPSSPSTFLSPDSSFFSEFNWENRPFSRQEHENRKRILNSLVTENEMDIIRDHIHTSFRKQ